MIEARTTLIITADTDEQIDAIYRAIHAAGKPWPETPVVQLREVSRELAREVSR